MKEAGLWDINATHPIVLKHTVQRAMADERYRKFRAKRRPKFISITAKERLGFANDWLGFDFGSRTIKFSDECSVARGSGQSMSRV